MQNRPSFLELLDAVRHFLETEVQPTQTEHRARFRTLVAINALTILGREFQHEPELVRNEAHRLVRLLGKQLGLPIQHDELSSLVLELNRELAALIRRGAAPSETLVHLREVEAAKLRVASPGYLRRYEQPGGPS